MKYFKRNLFVVLLILSVVLIGCGREGYIPRYDPYRGTQGLEMNFLDNAPPDVVHELNTFPVGIRLKNRGAYPITRGIININVERDYVSDYILGDTSIMLNGRTIYDQQGEEQIKLFEYRTLNMDAMSQIRDSVISITACYEYQTQLKTEACIDPDVFNLLQERNKPCTVRPQSFSGQGAPVGIVNIEPSISRSSQNQDLIIPHFEITVQNLNRGHVINRGTVMQYCTNQQMQREDFGIVHLHAELASRNLKCNPEIIRLDERGSGKTRCVLEEGILGTTTAYASLLDINLFYGYTEAISKKFKIQRQ